MQDNQLTIITNQQLAPGFYQMVFDAPSMEIPLPGQFVNVMVSEGGEPFLRRPFSVFDYKNGQLSILYKTIGKGTEILAAKKTGESLRVLGPLGTSFPIPDTDVLLIGGGVGIPPMWFLGDRLKGQSEIISCIGFRKSEEVILEKEFSAFSKKCQVTTDDGSYGIKGTVLDALNSFHGELPKTAYACGPSPMLRALKSWAAEKDIRLYVSLEEYMGCGIGICLSCAVKKDNNYVRVCTEGPVFAAEDVEF